MVEPAKKLTPMDYVAQFSPAIRDSFQGLRKAAIHAGPLDEVTCELIVLGAFATARIEAGFKVHAKRLLKDGVDIAKIRHAVLVTLGASIPFNVCIEALRWIDDVQAEAGP